MGNPDVINRKGITERVCTFLNQELKIISSTFPGREIFQRLDAILKDNLKAAGVDADTVSTLSKAIRDAETDLSSLKSNEHLPANNLRKLFKPTSVSYQETQMAGPGKRKLVEKTVEGTVFEIVGQVLNDVVTSKHAKLMAKRGALDIMNWQNALYNTLSGHEVPPHTMWTKRIREVNLTGDDQREQPPVLG